jgi:23S rRNA (pseudouridine1915-N3)-methyltransferase
MKISLVHIAPPNRASRRGPATLLVQEYSARSARMVPCEVVAYPTEAALLESLDRQTGRVATYLCLFDSTGSSLSSVEFAQAVGTLRDGGTQRIVFGIGPASGWSRTTLARADRIVSLGSFTLPHELARVVVAEQIYRALTILAGHPYHLGH